MKRRNGHRAWLAAMLALLLACAPAVAPGVAEMDARQPGEQTKEAAEAFYRQAWQQETIRQGAQQPAEPDPHQLGVTEMDARQQAEPGKQQWKQQGEQETILWTAEQAMQQAMQQMQQAMQQQAQQMQQQFELSLYKVTEEEYDQAYALLEAFLAGEVSVEAIAEMREAGTLPNGFTVVLPGEHVELANRNLILLNIGGTVDEVTRPDAYVAVEGAKAGRVYIDGGSLLADSSASIDTLDALDATILTGEGAQIGEASLRGTSTHTVMMNDGTTTAYPPADDAESVDDIATLIDLLDALGITAGSSQPSDPEGSITRGESEKVYYWTMLIADNDMVITDNDMVIAENEEVDRVRVRDKSIFIATGCTIGYLTGEHGAIIVLDAATVDRVTLGGKSQVIIGTGSQIGQLFVAHEASATVEKGAQLLNAYVSGGGTIGGTLDGVRVHKGFHGTQAENQAKKDAERLALLQAQWDRINEERAREAERENRTESGDFSLSDAGASNAGGGCVHDWIDMGGYYECSKCNVSTQSSLP